ncbi:MAG: hypothetical protein ABIJ34_05395 [archaeon]
MESSIVCEYKDKGNVVYIICEILDESVYDKIKEGQIVLICLNSKKNLEFMLQNWQKFIVNPKLKTIFSNPEVNLQWSLVPYTHNKYSDPASLKTGIKSIAENVPLV